MMGNYHDVKMNECFYDGGKTADTWEVDKNQDCIWMVMKKIFNVTDKRVIPRWLSTRYEGYLPYRYEVTRKDARDMAKFFNGFSHGTKDAQFRVRKYICTGDR